MYVHTQHEYPTYCMTLHERGRSTASLPDRTVRVNASNVDEHSRYHRSALTLSRSAAGAMQRHLLIICFWHYCLAVHIEC